MIHISAHLRTSGMGFFVKQFEWHKLKDVKIHSLDARMA